MKDLLTAVIAAVEAEGELLAAEFLRPDGPRGRRGSAPIDHEMEERLRDKLQALVPCPFVGEETGLTPGPDQTSVWIVDPHDGTFEFTSGKRGSAVSVALLTEFHPRARRGLQPALARPRAGHHRLGRRRRPAAAERQAGQRGSLPAAAGRGRIRVCHRLLRAASRCVVARGGARALHRDAEHRLPPGAHRRGRRRGHRVDARRERVRHRRRHGAAARLRRRGARRRRQGDHPHRRARAPRLRLLRRRARGRGAARAARLEIARERAGVEGRA